MKRVLSLLLAAGCIALCALMFRQWIEAAQQPPMAAIISTEEDGLSADLTQVLQKLEQDGYRTAVYADCSDLQAATEQLTAEGAQVIVYRIAGNLPDSDFTAVARKNGVAMIFAGQAPVRALNTQYDKLWYLGSSVNDAGEQLGQQVALAFKGGSVADANEDLTLNYLTVTDGTETADGIIAAITWECGLYGVSGADQAAVFARTRRAAVTSEELAEQWAALSRPEVILCVGKEYTQLAEQAARQLGWLDGDTPVQLAAVVESEAAARELLQSPVYCGMVYYDKAAELDALYTMTANLLEHRDISYGLELRRDVETPRFDLPYLRIEPDANK